MTTDFHPPIALDADAGAAADPLAQLARPAPPPAPTPAVLLPAPVDPQLPTLLTSDRAAVLGIVEQLLRDNAGNRITGALVLGIVTAAERSVPAREPVAPQSA